MPRCRAADSPFAQKKRIPIDIDEAAMTESSVFLNDGQRGLQIQLEPNDARQISWSGFA